MHIKSLSLINFKNYRQAEFSFDAGVNCFVGKNGSGKTNILDAVHYLSMCRSYLNPVDKQNIRFGEHFFVIQGCWELEGSEAEVYCGVKAGHKKVIKKNKLEYDRLADHIGLFPSVMISPYDRDLIAEGSEVRRKWMDGIISQFDRSYLDLLIRYGKILEQRNALLKQFYENGFFQRESMDVWDEQLIPVGEEIFEKRKQFVADFLTWRFGERLRVGKCIPGQPFLAEFRDADSAPYFVRRRVQLIFLLEPALLRFGLQVVHWSISFSKSLRASMRAGQ